MIPFRKCNCLREAISLSKKVSFGEHMEKKFIVEDGGRKIDNSIWGWQKGASSGS